MSGHAELLEAVAALLCERNGDAWEPQSDEFKEWGREDARAILSLIGERLLEHEIREIVEVYFEPWGAGKFAKWETLCGDGKFGAETTLRAIQKRLAASPLYPPKEE